MHFCPKPWLAGSSISMVTIWPTDGSGSAVLSPCHAIKIPLRLMFSVCMADGAHRAGEVIWHRSLMSIRGLSRLLIFFILRATTSANLASKPPPINIQNGLHHAAGEGYPAEKQPLAPQIGRMIFPRIDGGF